MHQYEAVLVLGEKAKNFAPCHQLTRCLEDNADAEVFRVAFDFDTEEFGRWAGVATHSVVYERPCENSQYSSEKSAN